MLTAEHADKPTSDGDIRLLVARCARRGIPVGIVDHHGALTLVRNLDDLEAARPDLRTTPDTEGTN